MKKLALVICEGETEETYIDLLRQRYRSPVKIVIRKSGSKLSQKEVNALTKPYTISPSDKIDLFLMFDRDVPEAISNLDKIDAVQICSNPCVEVWFLLHTTQPSSHLSTKDALNALYNSGKEWINYKKGHLTSSQKEVLWNNRVKAVRRAKALPEKQILQARFGDLLTF